MLKVFSKKRFEKYVSKLTVCLNNLTTFIFSVHLKAILFSREPYFQARSKTCKTHKMTECKKSVQCPMFQTFGPH